MPARSWVWLEKAVLNYFTGSTNLPGFLLPSGVSFK